MKINGLEGLTDAHVNSEIQRGARFVLYQYCMSFLIITLKRPSNIYFIRPEESAGGAADGSQWRSASIRHWTMLHIPPEPRRGG